MGGANCSLCPGCPLGKDRPWPSGARCVISSLDAPEHFELPCPFSAVMLMMAMNISLAAKHRNVACSNVMSSAMKLKVGMHTVSVIFDRNYASKTKIVSHQPKEISGVS
jgi:hypothetical protein